MGESPSSWSVSKLSTWLGQDERLDAEVSGGHVKCVFPTLRTGASFKSCTLTTSVFTHSGSRVRCILCYLTLPTNTVCILHFVKISALQLAPTCTANGRLQKPVEVKVAVMCMYRNKSQAAKRPLTAFSLFCHSMCYLFGIVLAAFANNEDVVGDRCPGSVRC